jgi:antitoxin MazE
MRRVHLRAFYFFFLAFEKSHFFFALSFSLKIFDKCRYMVYTKAESKGDGIMVTTIQKWGNSHAVRLPKVILEALFLKENDSVEISAESNSITIKKTERKRRAKKSIEERFENYTGDYKCEEYDWGKPVGREFW